MKYLDILNDWNFWQKSIDTGIDRNYYLDKLITLSKIPEIIAVTGIRRSGKSTILLQLIKRLGKLNKLPLGNFLYINFEDPRLGETFDVLDLYDLVEEYKKNLKPHGKIYIFLDEIQNVRKWEKYARAIYDRKSNIKLFLSGSSSTTFDSSLINLLSGRLIIETIHPLSFSEFLTFNSKQKSENIKTRFEEYLKFGGFPRVVLEKDEFLKREILISYYEAIIEKDVILKYSIRNKTEIKQLIRYVLSNISNFISSYSLEKILNISNENIRKYLLFLKESYIIDSSSYFSYSVKKQVYNPDKYYSTDLGLVNTAGFSFSENKGKMLENAVFNKLISKGNRVYYWKNGTETDFLVFKNNRVTNIINTTMTVDDSDVLNRELRSLDIASKAFPESEYMLLSLYNESGQKDPRIRPLLDFLLDK